MEFTRVLPELNLLLEKEAFNGTIGDRERLRLYDRLTKYLEEFSKDRPIYLIIDNIENVIINFVSIRLYDE